MRFDILKTENQIKPNSRISAYDIAKGIGVILVVFGHMNTYPTILQKIIYSFHMPLFFLLAGLVFSYKPGGGIPIRKE